MHAHNLSCHKRRVSTDWVANIIVWERPLNTCYMISETAGTILRGVYCFVFPNFKFKGAEVGDWC